MKKLLTIVAFCITVATVSAQSVYVRPYIKSNGTHVGGHYRSKADGIFQNNWTTKPNVNPHTGTLGTRISPYNPGNPFKGLNY